MKCEIHEIERVYKLKDLLVSEINFFNSLKSIYTEYPQGYSEVIKSSKMEIEAIIFQINKINAKLKEVEVEN